ncbi:family 59 putative glycosyltransferase [Triangularia verruculosa]|uniref:Dol-P-Glc:Glc(2)Man(9)GlcNAc(2)-PP-Dol alpha-1,2-glucosyltransferase n=1 Tax=Triangularia verruculosa TaxID=2587418 RepID=A0AAN6XD96_9PEZI|nr:family 59 putative glycosyltransferase [Triangularia verruculosa]
MVGSLQDTINAFIFYARRDVKDAFEIWVQSLRVGQLMTVLITSTFLAWLIYSPISTSTSPSKRRKSPWITYSLITVFLFLLNVVGGAWPLLVNRYVPEPYLDEFFHIPQAQTYCEGKYRQWDDKITTPPGLYLVSVLYNKISGLTCEASNLRLHNFSVVLAIVVTAAQCRKLIETRQTERLGKIASPGLSLYSFHVAINTALMPVVFFFSGLYYTDPLSTLVVLLSYRHHLQRVGSKRPGLLSDVWTILLGVAALFMRQTNVFWVVVYIGGLEAVHVLRSVKPAAQEFLTTLHDPPLSKSGPDDWLFCLLTIAVTALCNPAKVIRQIWPHITILGLFLGFVAWNGGVVLGDKSNHIATIHLAQMLYLWPFFAFFSLPLFLPSILGFITHPLRTIHSLVLGPNALFTVPWALLTTLLSAAVVKYNTIIHPFTLADNRHYMFYVFRYTILRSPVIRLLLVGPYTLARWLVWGSLSGSASTAQLSSETPKARLRTAHIQQNTPAATADDDTAFTLLDSPSSVSDTAPDTSTAILWLLTTALSLITAPLVEPRYFILPWVFYRLLVPSWSFSSAGLGRKIDLRLVLETIWFVAINAVTMYLFLFRPYIWKDNEGNVLDGGRLQRFMW